MTTDPGLWSPDSRSKLKPLQVLMGLRRYATWNVFLMRWCEDWTPISLKKAGICSVDEVLER